MSILNVSHHQNNTVQISIDDMSFVVLHRICPIHWRRRSKKKVHPKVHLTECYNIKVLRKGMAPDAVNIFLDEVLLMAFITSP